MKIAIECPIFWPMSWRIPYIYGGVELVVQGLANEWANMGHEIHMMCGFGSEAWRKDIEIHPAKEPIQSNDTVSEEAKVFNTYRDVYLNSDIIFANGHFMYPFLDKFNEKWKVPLCSTFHHHSDNLTSLPPVDYDHIISISNSQAKMLTDKFGLKSPVIYNGLRTELYNKAREHVTYENEYLFLGRMSTIKGIMLIPSLANAFPENNFVAMGDIIFTQEPQVAQDLIRAQLDMKNFKVIFQPTHEQKIEHLQRCKGLLNSGLWDEPFGIVNLEAFMFHKPVLGFNRGATSEIIVHRKNGYIINERGANIQEDAQLYGKGFQEFRNIKWNHKNVKVDRKFTIKYSAEEYIKLFEQWI